MESGWIIRCKTGKDFILNEKAYERYKKNTNKKNVQVEEHWFVLENAIKENPSLEIIRL